MYIPKSFTMFLGWQNHERSFSGISEPPFVSDKTVEVSITSGNFSTNGIANPRWRSQVKIPTTAGTGCIWTINRIDVRSKTDAIWHGSYKGSGRQWEQWGSVEGNYIGFNIPEAPWLYIADLEADVEADAAKRLFRLLRKLDHQFQGGVAFGEIVKTVKMIVDPMTSLRKGVGAYIRTARHRAGNVTKPKKIREILSDTWLEYSFGWVPLVSDVKDAAIAVARIVKNIPTHRFSVGAKATSDPDISKFGANILTLNDLFPFIITESRYHSYSLRYYGVLRPLEDPEGIVNQADKVISMSGFDFSSFIPTVWELIPFSFLVDYFSNVGDLLDQLATRTGSIVWMGSTEIKESNTLLESIVDAAALKSYWGSDRFDSYTGTGGSGISSSKVIARGAVVAIPYQGLRFNLGLTPKQITNLGALGLGGKIPKLFG